MQGIKSSFAARDFPRNILVSFDGIYHVRVTVFRDQMQNIHPFL